MHIKRGMSASFSLLSSLQHRGHFITVLCMTRGKKVLQSLSSHEWSERATVKKARGSPFDTKRHVSRPPRGDSGEGGRVEGEFYCRLSPCSLEVSFSLLTVF